MCLLCGDAGATRHGIAITERPAHRLGGLWWRGSFEDAAASALHPLIETVKDFSAARDTVWKSPIVGLSRNQSKDGFDYFVGIAVEESDALPSGFQRLNVPETTFASSWHGREDGDVVSHYGAMLEWLKLQGHSVDASFCSQREEYPHDVDLTQAPTLRLMLPVRMVQNAGATTRAIISERM
ncbi:GyrI-like domain-containing protein [Mesorhizobium sp. CAU 1741]|uniref:GyrI-like domain-containing protein n=1 Tax=Mesorhizobium sp. CAU 1741 TaxID=3140366 RepID=UPI00325B2E07